MVVPKGRGETKAAKKTSTKKTTSTKKSKTTKKDSPISKPKNDEVLKQRLKKLLEKEYIAKSGKSMTSGSSGNCNPCGTNNIRNLFTDDIQKFILKAAKKESLGKSTKKSDGFFQKQDNNKATTAKKIATKAATSTSKCVDGSCPFVKKTTAAKKPTTTTKKSTTAKKTTTKSSGLKCADGSCPFVKKPTTSKKSTASKLAPAGTKRTSATKKAPAKKAKTIPAKKSTVNKRSACGPCGKSGRTTKQGGQNYSRSSDSDDSEDDDDSSYDDSDSDDWSDSDSSDDEGGCGGGRCGPPRRGGQKGRPKRRDSSSSSWESDCPDGKCSYGWRRSDWNTEEIKPPIDNGCSDNSNNSYEKSVVPYSQKDQSSSWEDIGNEQEEIASSEESWLDLEYLSSSECSSDDFSEYSTDDFSEYSFNNNSSDDSYELPEDVPEDLYIRRGEAKVYEISDNDVQFDSDNSSAQIIEISSRNTVENRSDDKNEESDNSCPMLVPIDYNNLNEGSGLDETEENNQESSDDFEEEKRPLPMKPQIFKADKSSIAGYFNILLNNLEASEKTADISMEYVSPIERFVGNTSTPSKYKVVTANTKNCKIDAISNNKSKGKEPDDPKSEVVQATQSKSEVVQPIESKFFNSLISYQVILLLKKRIYFHGTLKVKLLAGAVEILGYNLQMDKTVETFSPGGSNLLFLEPKTGQHRMPKNQLKEKLEAFNKNFMTCDINEILKHYDQEHDAILLLERNDRDKKIDMIKKYMKENVFPKLNVNLSSPYYYSEAILRCRFHSKCYNSLRISSKWDSVPITDSTRLMVIGGKGVGKSTFLRYVLNKNLEKYKRFLLIDLDIGQPEIFLPQTISATLISQSILGPGYFYGLLPIKSYLFGDVNVVLSPLSYIADVKELLKYCRQENAFEGIPWIINTMGYNKGFGSELLSVIIQNLRPTDVVQLQSKKQYNNFDLIMNYENVQSIERKIYIDEDRFEKLKYKLFVIESAVPAKKLTNSGGDFEMLPKDIRFSMLISALGSIMSERDEWPTDVKPYSVPINALNIICLGEAGITKSDLLEVVNGNMVYLCNNSSTTIECYGIGIVRGIDKFQQKLYIIPSIPPHQLINVNTLATCNVPLAASILLNQGPKIRGQVPYTYNTNDFISSKHVPHHIYRPQHFLQGSRQNLLND